MTTPEPVEAATDEVVFTVADTARIQANADGVSITLRTSAEDPQGQYASLAWEDLISFLRSAPRGSRREFEISLADDDDVIHQVPGVLKREGRETPGQPYDADRFQSHHRTRCGRSVATVGWRSHWPSTARWCPLCGRAALTEAEAAYLDEVVTPAHARAEAER